MPVAEMRRRVSAQEYMQWGVWFGRAAQREEMRQLRARG